ncbi:MAG: preprotein translocase subunit SecY [Pseudomonadota bacterium]
MAKNRKNEEMAAGLAQSGKLDELRQRLMFLIGALIVYRIGTFVPVPGIDPLQLTEFFEQQSGNILAMFNMFSGGALQRFGIFALGVMPYISASIVMQMAAVVVPSLAKLKKEGESGRRKITDYTRRGTLLLALIQSFGAAYAIQNQPNLVVNPGISFMVLCIISLVTGTMFLMWLGEQITERGVGNGISIIILAGIIAGMPGAIAGTAELVSNGTMSPALALIILIAFIAMTVFVVYMESAQRRITVHYARRQQGRRMMQAQSTHLPFKVNMSGVIPPIFASSLLLFPVTLVQFSGADPDPGTLTQTLQRIGAALSPGQPIYIVLYGALVAFFCFFYTALMYNSREVADNLKRSGAFIQGIRPGQQTGEYIDKVLTRLTFWGALYITGVCLIPELVRMFFPSVPFNFGGTSLLILVVVTMDFMQQLKAHTMSQQYEGMMKKANIRNYSRT